MYFLHLKKRVLNFICPKVSTFFNTNALRWSVYGSVPFHHWEIYLLVALIYVYTNLNICQTLDFRWNILLLISAFCGFVCCITKKSPHKYTTLAHIYHIILFGNTQQGCVLVFFCVLNRLTWFLVYYQDGKIGFGFNSF